MHFVIAFSDGALGQWRVLSKSFGLLRWVNADACLELNFISLLQVVCTDLIRLCILVAIVLHHAAVPYHLEGSTIQYRCEDVSVVELGGNVHRCHQDTVT